MVLSEDTIYDGQILIADESKDMIMVKKICTCAMSDIVDFIQTEMVMSGDSILVTINGVEWMVTTNDLAPAPQLTIKKD